MLIVIVFILSIVQGKLKHHKLNHQAFIKSEENVYILDRDNFDAALMQFEVLLVEFYAPWCPHCQRLQPEFNEAAKILKQQNSIIKLGKVDCTQESELCNEFYVRGYPTLRIFYHDNIYHYYGDRTAKGIVKFMTTHLQEQKQIDKEK